MKVFFFYILKKVLNGCAVLIQRDEKIILKDEFIDLIHNLGTPTYVHEHLSNLAFSLYIYIIYN